MIISALYLITVLWNGRAYLYWFVYHLTIPMLYLRLNSGLLSFRSQINDLIVSFEFPYAYA